MRLIVLIAALVMPFFVNAQSIEVKGKEANYSFSYQKTFVNFKVGSHLMTWKVKPCGDWTYKNHFAVLKSKIKKQMIRFPADAKNTFVVTIDRKKYYYPEESSFANELKSFPGNFSYLKAQEVIACSK